MKPLRKHLILGALAASAVAMSPAMASEVIGAKIYVNESEPLDGRTFKIKSGEVYRLYGVLVPGPDHTCTDSAGADYDCGVQSRRALGRRMSGMMTCAPVAVPQNGEPASVRCYDMASRDLGALLVRSGWAVPDEASGGGQLYGFDAMDAQARGKGLWAGASDFAVW